MKDIDPLFGWRTARDAAMAQVADNAGEKFAARARAKVLEYLRANGGDVPGEDLTTVCLAAGIVPHDDRAFGPVYAGLARAGLIVRTGYAPRRRGHGSPGPVWRLA